MKRILYTGLLLLGVVILSSCEKDDAPASGPSTEYSQVVLDFYPMVGGQEIQIAERFENPQGYPVDITQMRFYLANIKLAGNLDTVLLSEISFVDIREHKSTLAFDVPPGDYNSVQFDLGVPVELNGTQNPNFTTSLFDANHPLSESNGMYWTWTSGYRFFVLDGNCDTLPNSSDFLPMPFSFHTGTDTLYREVPAFNREMSLGANDVESFHFGIELNRFFANGTDTVDLKVDRSFHGSYDQMVLGNKLANNTAASFQLINE